MAKELERVNGVTVYTRHYISTVDIQNRTFTIYGDFSDIEVMSLDEPGRHQAFAAMIDELTELEEMLRRMTAKEDA